MTMKCTVWGVVVVAVAIGTVLGGAEPAAAQNRLRALLKRPLPKAFNGPPPVATDVTFVPGSGSVVEAIGDDFEAENWSWNYRHPKSSEE